MATTVTLSRSSDSVPVNGYVDLVATVLTDGAPASGVAVTAASSNTSASRVIVGRQQHVVSDGGWGVTISYPNVVSPSGQQITRATFDTGTNPHETGHLVHTVASGSTLFVCAEIKNTNATRDKMRVGWDDSVSVMASTTLTPSTGVVAITQSTGTAYGGAYEIGDGWWYLWNLWVGGTHDGTVIAVVAGTEGGVNFAGNGTDYYDIGQVFLIKPATTDDSGNVTVRVIGVATGTANVSATASSVTSENTAITTIPAASLVLALDEPAPERADYIKSTSPWQVAEFDLDPIQQPASGTDIVIEYDASTQEGAVIKIEIIDPRVY